MSQEMAFKLAQKMDLTGDEIGSIMRDILAGRTDERQNLEFLKHLTAKGETDEELSGMLGVMKEFATGVTLGASDDAMDICGTGGDGLSTFNVSTCAGFIVAASGGRVAKHGNRSASGLAGSADIFERLGCDLEAGPDRVSEIFDMHGICFMFAPKFHPAMKHLASARRQFGQRTAFNILGPLCNPARVKNQLIGVSSADLLERIPAILKGHGSRRIMTAISDDKMDELSASAKNRVCLLDQGRITENIIDPGVLGLEGARLSDIQVSSKEQALRAFVDVLSNAANDSMIQTAAINAAAGLVVAGTAKNFDDGLELAMQTIKEEKAYKLLERYISDCGDASKLREVQQG